MTRRVRLVSLLVAIMALSGAYATSSGLSSANRVITSIAWSKSDRTRAQVQQRGTEQARSARAAAPASSQTTSLTALLA